MAGRKDKILVDVCCRTIVHGAEYIQLADDKYPVLTTPSLGSKKISCSTAMNCAGWNSIPTANQNGQR